MNIYACLSREHGIMLGLTQRVEDSFRRADGESAGREALKALYAALSRHEEIESQLMAGPPGKAEGEIPKLLRTIASQHREIEELRRETRALLKTTEEGAAQRLKVLAIMLVRRLRAHFECEELELWPLLMSLESRTMRRTLAHRAEENLRRLEKEFRGLIAPARL